MVIKIKAFVNIDLFFIYYIISNMNIEQLLKNEEQRQSQTISMVASENIASKRVRNALGSVLTNKYAEGYPGARYYSGCEIADEIETAAIENLKKLFDCKWGNVQAHSGSQANQAVYSALLTPGDRVLALELKSGGHLTHGASVNSSSKFYDFKHYTINSNSEVDMNEVEKLAKEFKPKMIICGASAYPRNWNWKEFSRIAKEVNAYLFADIAHIAGLIAGKGLENPAEYVDVMTSTTHKTLRGPRGGVVFSNNLEIGKKVDRAMFPGIQGGPLMGTIAAKAIAFEEALQPEFISYTKNVLDNAQTLSKKITQAGGKLLTGGTDNHLMILDCRSFGMDAKETEALLNEANILLSVSALLEDSWKKPNGIRLGTPYITTLGIEDISEFADLFVSTLKTKNAIELKKFVESNAKKLYNKFL